MNYITTSRKPSKKTRTFVKQIAGLFGSEYVVRGKNSISDLIANARYNGVNYILMVSEKKGNPNQLLVIRLDKKVWAWHSIYFVKFLRTRSEITKSDANVRINRYSFESENKALKFLIRDLKVKLDENSNVVVKDTKKGISIFKSGVEIGPAFDLYFAKQKDYEE